MSNAARITIYTGEKEISLSLNELRTIKQILNELIPEPIPTYPYPYPVYPVYPPYSPWYPWTYTTDGTVVIHNPTTTGTVNETYGT